MTVSPTAKALAMAGYNRAPPSCRAAWAANAGVAAMAEHWQEACVMPPGLRRAEEAANTLAMLRAAGPAGATPLLGPVQAAAVAGMAAAADEDVAAVLAAAAAGEDVVAVVAPAGGGRQGLASNRMAQLPRIASGCVCSVLSCIRMARGHGLLCNRMAPITSSSCRRGRRAAVA